ncbi:sugar-binding transcriptional regulator [Bombilactobacillus folatiphilus]|uniref:Sugar-binding transcriptional regulator n=1 Tax=Bombilactobacillus folatiphilus TaxID=2923362 RepID=A0ABY4P8B8_9LACO|nr:sugar-binding domain-containing protein [Bombilactobacillus folatiphilus]UQS81934.1 sugar-binding transcriptional regulator [Bombilactobacillus folatiphilus]
MDHRELLASVAQDFYLSKLNLAEIAAKYRISRYLVNKYIDEATQEGIVTINIQTPAARNLQLEQQFHKLFGISNIYILKEDPDSPQNVKNVQKYAAKKIERYIKQSHVIGTTWGTTIFNVINQFQGSNLENTRFTQFIGENMKYNSAVGSRRMVERAALKFSSSYNILTGPLYIVNNQTRQGMLREIATQETLKLAQRMELIFTGIGTIDSVKSIPAWGKHLPLIFPQVNLMQIVGMTFGRPYDINGKFLNIADDKTFGTDLETILNTPLRVAVVTSKFKSKALLGALRGNFFTDIITNESVAWRVIYEVTKG